MATSSEMMQQIQTQLGQLDPMLANMPTAADYYKKKVGEAYDYNKPALETAAKLEGKLYSMPGELMSQYDTEFGGQTGISSNQRIQSILQSLGRQSGLANTAWGVADRLGTRQDELAKSLADQYNLEIQARQQKLNPLLSIWDRMYSEEQANARAARSGGGGTVYVNPWEDAEYIDDETTVDTTQKDKTQTDTTQANTKTGGGFQPGKILANTGLSLLDQYMTNSKFGNTYKGTKNIVNTGKNVVDTGKGLVNLFNKIF